MALKTGSSAEAFTLAWPCLPLQAFAERPLKFLLCEPHLFKRRRAGRVRLDQGESRRIGFAREPGGIVVPPLVLEGIIGGLGGVARARLRAGRAGELPGLADDLIEWALSCPGTAPDVLTGLDRAPLSKEARVAPRIPPSTGERDDLLASVSQLAVAIGYEKLTVTRIRTVAKVSRKAFDAHFEGVEDCFVAAL
jgi:hypothetical protein